VGVLPRFITVLSLLQFLFIAFGYLSTRAFIRCFELQAGPGATRWWPGPVRLVRDFGLWFLLVPAAWYAAHLLRRRPEGRAAPVNILDWIAGPTLTAGIGLMFLMASLGAFGGAFLSS
jgi:hypothetical protein